MHAQTARQLLSDSSDVTVVTYLMTSPVGNLMSLDTMYLRTPVVKGHLSGPHGLIITLVCEIGVFW